jgi:hypothetical protein
MTPARTRLNRKALRICELLVSLGLPRKDVHGRWNKRSGSFWHRNENVLDLWLERAHTAYRQRMINMHPDKGGEVEDAKELNRSWSRVRHLFRKHGVTL